MVSDSRAQEQPPRPLRQAVADRRTAISVRAPSALMLLWRLVAGTVRVCLRYRVTGLAAEAGFFALLSLPPLVLGLVASVGYAGQLIGADVLSDLKQRISQLAAAVLTPDAVSSVILPTFDEVTKGGRIEFVSIGFALSVWSGSRSLNVYVDTISIMYGLGGRRGIVRTRVLSLSLYLLSLLLGIVVIPLVLIGPGLLDELVRRTVLPWAAQVLQLAYWPALIVLALIGLTSLYHIATPVRSPWRRDLPGALLAFVIWVLSSFVLRMVIAASVGDSTSIYGPLAAPIVMLIWLYFLAIAVLIGAALNATIDELYPTPSRLRARRDNAVPTHRAITPVPE